MVEAISRAHAFAPAATPVVLYGQTGSGKTFFAQYIHQVSGRSGGFHDFSLGTVAPQLALDELFGHVKGAFTDARENRRGQIVSAGTGTLLLDDFHTLDLGIQKQLLQVLDRTCATGFANARLRYHRYANAAPRFGYTRSVRCDTGPRKLSWMARRALLTPRWRSWRQGSTGEMSASWRG